MIRNNLKNNCAFSRNNVVNTVPEAIEAALSPQCKVLMLIADKISGESFYGGDHVLTLFITGRKKRTVFLRSLSKTHSLAGF